MIVKNELRFPAYRIVERYIYVIYKDPNDNSCQVGAFYMRENYAGGGMGGMGMGI